MSRKTRKRVWPYLVIVGLLFFLTIYAPREWCTLATTTVAEMEARVLAHLAVETPARPLAPAAGAREPALERAPTAASEIVVLPQPSAIRLERQPAPSAPEPLGSEAAGATVARSAPPPFTTGLVPPTLPIRAVAGPPVPLAHFATSRRESPVDPPVADQFVPAKADEAPAAPEEPLRVAATPLFRRVEESRPIPAGSNSLGVLPRQTPSVALGGAWPHPVSLETAVSRLGEWDAYRAWADVVLTELRRLTGLPTLASPEASPVLQQLQLQATAARTFADAEQDPARRTQLSRTAHALSRRLAVWEQVYAVVSEPRSEVTSPVATSSTADLQQALTELDAMLGRTDPTARWRKYLLIDEAQRQFIAGELLATAECRALAKQVLLRLEPIAFTAAQREYLQQPVVTNYAAALRPLTIEPIDYFRLLAALEAHETAPSAKTALHLAAAQQMLRWSGQEPLAELGRRIDTHYRNANIRMTVGKGLVDRLLPRRMPVSEDVDEIIQGARTLGHSSGATDLETEFVPCSGRWYLTLIAHGEMDSETHSHSGPATFFNEGTSAFRAEKELVVGPEGIQAESATAEAESASGLTGLSTELDSVPIFGSLAHSIALRQYGSRSSAAQSEAAYRVALRASQRLDREVDPRLEEAGAKFSKQVYAPLRRMSLNPALIDMQTTPDTLIARARLAGFHQLGAFTPRMRAPENSLLSLQVHESAVNNIIDQLGWAGRRVKADALPAELAKLLNRPAPALPEDFPEDVVLEFADENPVRVAFQEGRLTITLGLKELAQGKTRWRDFVVQVHYCPEGPPPASALVRDQYVTLIGKRLGLRDQVALRGIFSRVFARNQPIDLVSKKLTSDPRLAGLEVSQLALDDGWFGVALSDTQSAER